MSEKVIHLFGNDDPRINSLVQELKSVIYKRSVGIFQLATVLGVLRTIEHELVAEMKD